MGEGVVFLLVGVMLVRPILDSDGLEEVSTLMFVLWFELLFLLDVLGLDRFMCYININILFLIWSLRMMMKGSSNRTSITGSANISYSLF